MAQTNQNLHLPGGALNVPDSQNLTTVKLWCEYGIWGLLFYDDQSPWRALIECLHVCFDKARKGEPIFDGVDRGSGGAHEVVRYSVPMNWTLRHLIFRDRDILRIADSESVDENAMWTAWQAALDRSGVKYDYKYLRSAFKNFGDFARAVELLRSAEIESHTEKRWTSKHLLPLGPSMIFPDVSEDGHADRKYLRRTGELMYLMLNRSDQSQKLEELIRNRLLPADSAWNRLAARLAGPDQSFLNEMHGGYLPLGAHEIYNRLAADWVSLLSLDSIPTESILDPLQRISGLLQSLYIIERARETIDDGVPIPPFFLDLVGAPGNNPIRKLSANQHKRHRTMITEAMNSYLDLFAASEDWQAVLENTAGRTLASHLLTERFRWPAPSTPDPDRLPSAEQQLADLRSATQAGKSHSIGPMFGSHTRQIGMLRSARGAGTWYAPTDNFLESLVLTNVRSPMEFGDFLQLLLRRYNLVIGPEEVRQAFRVNRVSLPAPQADLQENERRLEERLRVLGFLDRKSDDCAFVINPFYRAAPTVVGDKTLVPA